MLCIPLYTFQFVFGITEATRGTCEDVSICLEKESSCGDYDNWIFSTLYLLGLIVLLTALTISTKEISKEVFEESKGSGADTARLKSSDLDLEDSMASPSSKSALKEPRIRFGNSSNTPGRQSNQNSPRRIAGLDSP